MGRAQQVRQARTVLVAVVGGALVLGSTATAQAGAPPRGVGLEQQNLPGVPEPGAPTDQWQEWAAQDRAEAVAHDWAAESAARGCELIEVEVADEVDEEYNRAMGAPADLVTTRVEQVEDCGDSDDGLLRPWLADRGPGGDRLSADATVQAVPSGPQRCNYSTHGPGTLCVYSSGGRVHASWKYRGSGSVTGFLRVYTIPRSASGCPTGSTWHTGPTSTWTTNQTRTTSKTRTSSAAYSAHIWRKVGGWHTSWGQTCAVL